MRKIFITLVCIILFTVPVHAEFIVEDDAGLLSNYEISQLQDLAEETYQQELNDIDVVICTSYAQISSREQASSSAYNELSTHPDGVIVYVNMDCREIDVSGRGTYEDILPDKACQWIYDDVAQYFTDADYLTGFEKYINMSYKYSHDPTLRRVIIVVSLILEVCEPILVGLIVLVIGMVIQVRTQLKNRKGVTTEDEEQFRNSSTKTPKVIDTVLIGHIQTKTIRESSSGSSGSSGGGSHGGGSF